MLLLQLGVFPLIDDFNNWSFQEINRNLDVILAEIKVKIRSIYISMVTTFPNFEKQFVIIILLSWQLKITNYLLPKSKLLSLRCFRKTFQIIHSSRLIVLPRHIQSCPSILWTIIMSDSLFISVSIIIIILTIAVASLLTWADSMRYFRASKCPQ